MLPQINIDWLIDLIFSTKKISEFVLDLWSRFRSNKEDLEKLNLDISGAGVGMRSWMSSWQLEYFFATDKTDKEKKSNFHYARNITPKHEASLGPISAT